jgi:small subunit ribosomal protein S15
MYYMRLGGVRVTFQTFNMLSKRKKENAIKNTQRHDSDTGSAEVQVSVLSKKIEELAGHLKKHKKDFHSRRGLLQMVADRRKHLKYLERKKPQVYADLIKKLGLKR